MRNIEHTTEKIIKAYVNYFWQGFFEQRVGDDKRTRRFPFIHIAVDTKHQIWIFKYGRIINELLVTDKVVVELFGSWNAFVVTLSTA